MRTPAAMASARPLVGATRTMFRLLWTVSAPLTATMLATTVVAAAAPVGLFVVAGALIERLTSDGAALSGGTDAWLLAVPALLLVGEAGRQRLGVTSATLGRRADGALQEQVLGASLEPVGIAHLEDPDMREVFAAARNLSPYHFTPGVVAQQLPLGMVPRIQGLVAVGVVAAVSPLIGAVALAAFVVGQVWTIGTMLTLHSSTSFGALTPDIVYLRELALTSAPAKEVRVFGLGRWLDDRFGTLAHRKLDEALAAQRGQVPKLLQLGAWFGAGTAVTAGPLAWKAADGRISVAALVTVVLASTRIFNPPNTMADITTIVSSFTIAAVDRAIAQPVPSVPRPTVPSPPPALGQAIVLDRVRFGYGEVEVFDGLDLAIPAGQQLAVVGLNGAGKTTLVKLLCRLYDPVAGSVAVDGVDLRDVDPDEWRRRLGVLFQDFVRWELPAVDNVGLRDDEHAPPAPGAVDAARRAGVLDLIEGLPNGWDTPLSSGLRGGVDLSGGQWQRVALARALHAVDRGARLLIFDEPTANLDAHGEQRFFDDVLANPALRAAPDGQPVTTILISHRFATVRHADRIVVLGDGHVLEDGDHAGLLALGGRYASLFELQAKAFQEEVR